MKIFLKQQLFLKRTNSFFIKIFFFSQIVEFRNDII